LKGKPEEKKHVRDMGDNIKMDLKENRMRGCELDLDGSG
jgi:hypothetical protein